MNVDLIVTAAATIGGVLVGSFTSFLIERNRRRSETRFAFRNERKAVYANFMACVVRWQNEVAWRWDARFVEGAEPEVVMASDGRIEELHQATMAPLFELRMVGSSAVVVAAENVIQFVYRYQEAHESPERDKQSLNSEWVLHRDAFIRVARDEVLAV